MATIEFVYFNASYPVEFARSCREGGPRDASLLSSLDVRLCQWTSGRRPQAAWREILDGCGEARQLEDLKHTCSCKQ